MQNNETQGESQYSQSPVLSRPIEPNGTVDGTGFGELSVKSNEIAIPDIKSTLELPGGGQGPEGENAPIVPSSNKRKAEAEITQPATYSRDL
jgi:hypothetical protein